ncbi:TPA: thymidylate synthase ThyX [Streptococcus suis]|uniref:thymidylate synthase ThyX n=1 Tax=Streptococcus agalactiae TaxID=1311 RepID=UPI001302F156|nr:thymidylate synthase ThyX [Streptococcus agalactiae]KAF0072955.1 thymidylate synthase ThyX [Streptococcus agalactiae]
MDIKIKKINFEGNILKVIKATVTEMRGINNHQKYDFDLYQIEARSPMSTREITLTVDLVLLRSLKIKRALSELQIS